MKPSTRNKTCCFTGHRTLPPQAQAQIVSRLEPILIDLIHSGVHYFGTGGALGFDTLAAQTVLRLRDRYPQIKLILVLPCRSQANNWQETDVNTYNAIKQAADKVVYTSETYTPDCMYKRNRHLVDHSSICICYLTQRRGGTFYTVNYAKTQGLHIINLADTTS